LVVLVLLLLRSETRSSGWLIGCTCVAVTPFGDTQQWRADWLYLCCCYSVRRHAAVEGRLVLVLLLFRSETLSSGGLIGSCVAVTPFGGTQQ
jgi:hypothetical protein